LPTITSEPHVMISRMEKLEIRSRRPYPMAEKIGYDDPQVWYIGFVFHCQFLREKKPGPAP
jgi:hypothetical protein